MIWKCLLTETKHNLPEILVGWLYCIGTYLLLGQIMPAFGITLFDDGVWAVAVVPGVFAVPLTLNKKGRYFSSNILPLSLRQIYLSKTLFYLILLSLFAVTLISLELIFNQGNVSKMAVLSCFSATLMIQLYELSNNLFVLKNTSAGSSSGKQVLFAISMFLLFVGGLLLIVFLTRGLDYSAIRSIAYVGYYFLWICCMGIFDYRAFLKRKEYA